MIIPTLDINASLLVWLWQQNYTQVFVLCDSNTARDCLPFVTALYTDFLEIEAGEQHKNIETVQKIWAWLLEKKADRNAVLLNLGGGVVGDMGGFAAATYKRGIDFVQIPTSLLAMVDASVGGKVGIDFGGIKNSIGAFCQPTVVFLAPQFLATLPEREFRSGLAEVIKHELLGDTEKRDHVFARWHNLAEFRHLSLKQTADLSTEGYKDLLLNALYWITENVTIKQAIVEEDPLEKNRRKVLNLGHTLGHALESFSLNTAQPLLHGEAVALGLIGELYLSTKKVGLKQKTYKDWVAIIHQNFPNLQPLFSKEDYETLWELMLNDKKNKNGMVHCVLLERLGKPVWDIAITKQDAFEAFDNLLENSF